MPPNIVLASSVAVSNRRKRGRGEWVVMGDSRLVLKTALGGRYVPGRTFLKGKPSIARLTLR
jgi:hypothetical protein